MKIHQRKNQRHFIEDKIRPWQKLREDRRPPEGWLKTIRKTLGLNTRQLADRLGVRHSSVLRLEKREVQDKITIASLSKAAKAMNCQLIYAIVPKTGFNNLNEITEQQAKNLASYLVKKAEHNMKVESQGISAKETKKQISQLATELKTRMNSDLWEYQNKKVKLPEFETERLFLRGVQLKDAKSYEKSFADYNIIQHLSHLVPWPYPKGAVKDFLKKTILPKQGITRWMWVIFLKDKEDTVIGAVDLWREGYPENRGFWLAKQHWGKGFMTEALKPITDYAFNHLRFKKLIFANAVGNNRSRRIKEKTGAVYLKSCPGKFVNLKYKEKEIWELTRENWKTQKKSQ